MMLMLASTGYFPPELGLILVFVFVVVPVSLISLIANWLIRPWWVALLIGPLVCLVVMVAFEHHEKAIRERALGPAVNSDAYSKAQARQDDEFVKAVTA